MEIYAELFCITVYDFIFTYYIILQLYPVNYLHPPLGVFFSPKTFVLIISNPDQFCYSTDALAFSINHLYFKMCNLPAWLLTPMYFLFLTFGRSLCFTGAFSYRMSLFSNNKKTTFSCLENHGIMILWTFRSIQITNLQC